MGRSPEAYKHADLTQRIIKVFYAVYDELGHGFAEIVYQRAFAFALQEEGLNAERERRIAVWFRSRLVGAFRADVVVEDKVLVELKCGAGLDSTHESQLLNYLRATDLEVGLLLNFGPSPAIRRFAYDNRRKQRLR